MTNKNTETAISVLLTPHGVTIEDLESAFAELSGKHIDFADFYFQRTVSEGYVLEEGIIKNGSFNTDMGVGVRAVSGEKSALAYSDEISKNALVEAVRTVRAIGDFSDDKTVVKLEKRKIPEALYQPVNSIELKETKDKIEIIKKLDKLARKLSPHIIQVMCSISSVYEVILIAKRDGALAGDIRPLVRANLSVVVQKDGKTERGTAGGGGRFSLDYFTDEKLASYAEEAVSSALRNLEAIPVPAGVFPVVLGPGWPGVLLHEAVGHGLEGDFNRKGTSVFADKIGQRVAAEGVTIVDNGTVKDRRGSLTIDDEGNPTQCTVLIENGILKGYMQDELNASLMGQTTTGNCRRESFAALPIPRMTNTYMLSGDKEPAEIISSVDYGIYAKNFGGGQVDITSGKFAFSMSEAWLIEKGKITQPVKGATLIGNGHEALLKIKLIGNDSCLDGGVGICGKDGQSVPVGVGMPTLRIDGLTVGGTS